MSESNDYGARILRPALAFMLYALLLVLVVLAVGCASAKPCEPKLKIVEMAYPVVAYPEVAEIPEPGFIVPDCDPDRDTVLVGYVNIYMGSNAGLYDTSILASLNSGLKRLACKRITYRVGEFDE